MKNLGYIASEITKGKNLSDNLVKYGKGLSHYIMVLLILRCL